jgi:hypothetical protein
MRIAWGTVCVAIGSVCVAIGSVGVALAEEPAAAPAHQADATTHVAPHATDPHVTGDAGATATAHHPPLPYTHPDVPEPSAWPGVTLLVIAGMFFAAAVIGPIVRANMEEELPPTHSHDEDHGHGAAHDPQPDTAGHGHGDHH